MSLTGLLVKDAVGALNKMDPVEYVRCRQSCKFMNAVAVDCRHHIKVPIVLKDLVIGPVPLPVTKREAKQQKRGEVRFYAVYVFPHDNEYFDIKPDGTCSSHLNWTTQREMIPYDSIEESLAGFNFEHVEIRWISTNPWVRYPTNLELTSLTDRVQNNFGILRLSEFRLETIQFLASRLKPKSIKLHNLVHPIKEDITQIFTAPEFEGTTGLIVEGSMPFTCFCTCISTMAGSYQEFMYVKSPNNQRDKRSENVDRLGSMITTFIKDWTHGAEFKLRNFFVSNISIPIDYIGSELMEQLSLASPNQITSMYYAPVELYNREGNIYHECVVLPRLVGRGLMVIGVKSTDIFIRIVYTLDEYLEALAQVYATSPIDFSSLARDTEKFEEYLLRLD